MTRKQAMIAALVVIAIGLGSCVLERGSTRERSHIAGVEPWFGSFAKRGHHSCEAIAARSEWMLGYLKSEIGVTPGQQDDWEQFALAAHAAVTEFGKICHEERNQGVAQSLPARLDRAEAWLVMGLALTGKLKPPLEALYASLEEGQRTKLEAMATWRRH